MSPLISSWSWKCHKNLHAIQDDDFVFVQMQHIILYAQEILDSSPYL